MTPHRWRVRVYYEDVDLAGIVYHANHLRFAERARSEMVREAGVDQAAMRAAGLVFVVTRVEADYLRPARYDEMLDIETTVGEVGRARFTVTQTMSRDGELLFRARVTVACMDLDGRPRRMPEAIAAMAAS